MSLIPKQTVQIIAQGIGISHLGEDVAAALAPDAEYRMREIIQEAMKCMRHSKRSNLTTDDVDSALKLRNVEPLYGFSSADPLRFRKAAGLPDVFFVEDREVDLKEILECSLPRVPIEPSLASHWLAIEGVQPAIPENVPIQPLVVPPPANRKAPGGTPKAEQLVEMKPAVKHVLSKELQLYFEKVTEIVVLGRQGGGDVLSHALSSLASDAGLHPLLPYLTHFVKEEVERNMEDLGMLFALMRVVNSLLQNPHLHIELYLHQLMPSVITCLAGKRLGGNATPHWRLRDYCATLIASICRKFGSAHLNLQGRVTRTLLHTLLDPKKAFTAHYGALRALAALGGRVVEVVVLPNLGVYLQLLQRELEGGGSQEKEREKEKEKDKEREREREREKKQQQAVRVLGALQEAVGMCMGGRMREEFPGSFLGEGVRKWKRVQRVASESPPPGSANQKRKAEGAEAEAEEQKRKVMRWFGDDDDVADGDTMPKSTSAEPVVPPPPIGGDGGDVEMAIAEETKAAEPQGTEREAERGEGGGGVEEGGGQEGSGAPLIAHDKEGGGGGGGDGGTGGNGDGGGVGSGGGAKCGEGEEKGGIGETKLDDVSKLKKSESAKEGRVWCDVLELLGEPMLRFVPLPELELGW